MVSTEHTENQSICGLFVPAGLFFLFLPFSLVLTLFQDFIQKFIKPMDSFDSQAISLVTRKLITCHLRLITCHNYLSELTLYQHTGHLQVFRKALNSRTATQQKYLRDNVVIHEGTLKTLKRFKDEVPEVQSG